MNWYQYRFCLEIENYDEESAFFCIAKNAEDATADFMRWANQYGWLDNSKSYDMRCLWEVYFVGGSWKRKFSNEYENIRRQLVECEKNDDLDGYIALKRHARNVLSESEMESLDNCTIC